MSTSTEEKIQKNVVQKVERSWLGLNFHKSEFVFHCLILFAIWLLSFMVRLFSVVRYESMIHEFDPWFNYRSTKYLVDEGFYAFHNWYDKMTWYPLGIWIGNTVYPGMMFMDLWYITYIYYIKSYIFL